MNTNQTENNINNINNNVNTGVKKKGRFFDSVKDNLQKIIICLVSVFYITQGMFTIVKKDTTIWDIVGNIGLSIMVGLILTNSLNTSGLKDGRKTEEFTNSMKAYGAAKLRATPYLDKLSPWCEYKNFQNLQIKKKEIIQDCGLNWRAYKFGYYDEPENRSKLNKDQLKAIEEAKNCIVPKLTYSEMLSDLPKRKYFKFGKEQVFGESEQDYKNRNVFMDFIYKFFMAIIGGLYALSPLMNQENIMETLSGVLWNTTQIIIWLALGILKYVNAKSFMTDEYRQTHVIQKTELFNEFIITMEKNPTVIENYSEDIEIDRYIQEFLNKKEKEEKEEEVVEKVEEKEDGKDEQENVLD